MIANEVYDFFRDWWTGELDNARLTPKIADYSEDTELDDKDIEQEYFELKGLFLGEVKSLPNLPTNTTYTNILNGAHTLIAGRTGSGKSVFLHGLLAELMKTKQPNFCGLLLIDPKRVELQDYKDTRYSIGYADNNAKAVLALALIVELIDDRYAQMQAKGLKLWDGGKIYIVIDELADLLIDADFGVKAKKLLQKILQIGRASGVSVIAATQCPARSVIPAALTLNFTERIALKCNAAIESRQIINQKGAELLPSHGQGLYLGAEGLSAIEIPMLDEQEENYLIDYWSN